MSSKWESQDAHDFFLIAKKYFGNPDVLDKNTGGIAIWLKKTLEKNTLFDMPNCFAEMMLRDESVSHNCPKKHTDFFYSYVNVDIPPKMLMDVLSLSGSVSYDPLKKLLAARCGSLAANIATLKLATDIINKNVTISKIQENGLYGETISSTYKNDPNTKPNPYTDYKVVKKLYAQLCYNLKKQKGNKAHTGYWKAAFNKDCENPNKKMVGGNGGNGVQRFEINYS